MEDFIEKKNQAYLASQGLTVAYLVLLMVMGLAGNSLVLAVYYRRFKPSVTRTYILAMSVCDLMTNCLALPSDIYEMGFYYNFTDDAGCKFFGFITRFLALQGAFTLIAIAVDRRRKVCQPTRKPRELKHVYIELACLSVFALVYAVPFGILRGLQTIPLDSYNVTTCSIDDQYVGSLFFVIYNGSTGLTFIICVTIMGVCYALIARHLWLHRKRLLQNARKRQTPEKKTSKDSHKRTEEQAKTDHQKQKHQNLNDSTNAFTVDQSEDEDENRASPGRLQLNVTDDSDVTSDLDNTTTSSNTQTSGIPSSSLTNISETSFSGDVTSEDIKPSLSDDKNFQKPLSHKLREATMVANACKTQTIPANTTSRPKAKKSSGSKHGTSKKIPGRTTLMMFILAAMYVVSYLPYLSMAAVYRGKDLSGEGFWVRNLHQVALRSFFINSAVNPVVYSFCSVQFRRECRHFLCRR